MRIYLDTDERERNQEVTSGMEAYAWSSPEVKSSQRELIGHVSVLCFGIFLHTDEIQRIQKKRALEWKPMLDLAPVVKSSQEALAGLSSIRTSVLLYSPSFP